MMRNVIPFFMVLVLAGCTSEEKLKQSYLEQLDAPAEEVVDFEYPLNGTVFPPEFPAPSVLWNDEAQQSQKWFLHVEVDHRGTLFSGILSQQQWKPDESLWKTIRENSVEKPAVITVLGINPDKRGEVFSKGQIKLITSRDSVGAPVFFRAVPLPFSYATSHLDSIKYMLGDVSSEGKALLCQILVPWLL